tara:strand:- start:50687 stop:51100 length:414 start_codon:yes stop_codon:yes gene_type:complete
LNIIVGSIVIFVGLITIISEITEMQIDALINILLIGLILIPLFVKKPLITLLGTSLLSSIVLYFSPFIGLFLTVLSFMVFCSSLIGRGVALLYSRIIDDKTSSKPEVYDANHFNKKIVNNEFISDPTYEPIDVNIHH